ncbi:MAG: hypothetical protein Greene041614_1035 [Parcubacteria group bacterium Greene0416_14]|nr:MAG: hypothetical protein Greene041614_1035 [Parcubacteria group bacterium Greene0416_14]
MKRNFGCPREAKLREGQEDLEYIAQSNVLVASTIRKVYCSRRERVLDAKRLRALRPGRERRSIHFSPEKCAGRCPDQNFATAKF